ncbi:hypothetical protein ALC56_03855, partial [Trachymyrmex septentrionalis]
FLSIEDPRVIEPDRNQVRARQRRCWFVFKKHESGLRCETAEGEPKARGSGSVLFRHRVVLRVAWTPATGTASRDPTFPPVGGSSGRGGEHTGGSNRSERDGDDYALLRAPFFKQSAKCRLLSVLELNTGQRYFPRTVEDANLVISYPCFYSRYFSRVHPSCFDGLDDFGIIDILDVCIEGVAGRKGSSPKFDIISRLTEEKTKKRKKEARHCGIRKSYDLRSTFRDRVKELWLGEVEYYGGSHGGFYHTSALCEAHSSKPNKPNGFVGTWDGNGSLKDASCAFSFTLASQEIILSWKDVEKTGWEGAAGEWLRHLVLSDPNATNS